MAIYDFNQSDGKTYKSEYHQDTREIPFSMKTNKQLVVVHQELNYRGAGNKSLIIGSHVLYTTGAPGLMVVYILSSWQKQTRSSWTRPELNCSSLR